MSDSQSPKSMAPTDSSPASEDELYNLERPLFEIGQSSANMPGNVSGSPITEHGAVASRCSVRLIHEIVSKFSPEKVQLVRSIGFEGILHIPLLKQVNLRFSTCLMRRVDELLNRLAVPDGTYIEFNKHDVALVFGIPVGGTSIFTKPSNLHGCVSDASSGLNAMNAKYFRSIKAAQSIVCMDHESTMSPIEQDEFRAAFVVFVMSTLLAPCAKHDRVSDDYLHAIQSPAQIRNYDWAEYVLRRLLDAVAKLKTDIANNAKAPYIYGCSLFLQVLYLDSIDLGFLSMDHDVFPRIRCFTSDRIRSMIAADSSFSLCGSNMVETRRIKLRQGDGLCYHWARTQDPKDVSPVQKSRLLALWELSVTMTRVLKIPSEAAGPLFIAASDLQRQMKCDLCPDAIKVLDVFFHLIEPYLNGFSYKPSISLDSRPIDLCTYGHETACLGDHCCYHFSSVRIKRKRNISARECSSNGQSFGFGVNCTEADDRSPSSTASSYRLVSGDMDHIICNPRPAAWSVENRLDDVDIRVMNAMARFYMTLSPVKATRCSDLNSSPLSVGLSVEHVSPGAVITHHVPRSPWELGYRCSIDLSKAADIIRKLRFVEDIDEPWIVHFCPKYVEVITRAIKEQCIGNAEFEMEFVDAAIRRFKQIDDELYVFEGPVRWRHYVESDFMVSLLAGCFDIMDPVIRAHFCGRHINYDVTACRILFFPLIIQYRWVCFAWRMDDNTIVVYDPCTPRFPGSALISSYERVVKLLKSAMMAVSSSVIRGWSHDWEHGRIEIFNYGSRYSHISSANRTGLMCLHFCRCFDGDKICHPINQAHIQEWSASILGEVSSLGGNWGAVPNFIR